MFEVTTLAIDNLKAYLEQNKVNSAIRVTLMPGGCSGASLALSLDEPNDSDKVFDENGLKFLMEESLLERCGTVKVDFIEAGFRSGFSISSANSLGGGSCSSGSCSGSCGWNQG